MEIQEIAESETQTIRLYHHTAASKVESIKKEGIKPTAFLKQEGKQSWSWGGNKGSWVFLRHKYSGDGPAIIVDLPVKDVFVANELLHVNDPGKWEGSIMPYSDWLAKEKSLVQFSPEFLVLGPITTDKIAGVIE